MNFSFLSGLPRTGSTLLQAILAQNPDIHAEGLSAVCQLMWDSHISCGSDFCQYVMKANNKTEIQHSIVSAIPQIYYKNVSAKNILDKCRSWTLPDNIELIEKYITDKPRIIVMVRPIEDIVASFIRLRKANGWSGDLESDLWEPNTEPITRPIIGVEYAKSHNDGKFLFVEYDDLVDYTPDVVNKIYEFMEWDLFSHKYSEIVHPYPENDEAYEMPGLHHVRPEIGRRK